jgi:sterol desaturase/sphingolipid hydroxylase (fatty acid hydroxylase superfamily)
MDWLHRQETVEWVLFIGAFLGIAVWETFLPQHDSTWSVARRWRGHALLFAISGIVSAVLLRVSAVAVASAVSGSRFGLLNRPWLPALLRFALALGLLDLVRYATHRVFHAVPFLWRIHEVHHSDPDYDVSTAVRFHPLETLLDQLIFLAAVWLLAPDPLAVFVSELGTTLLNLFAHANGSVPAAIERLLQGVLITPQLHRIHHSQDIEDQQRNFGQTFSWWDRVFGTWRGGRGDQAFATGIRGLSDERIDKVGFMLREPFLTEDRNRSSTN